MPCEFDGLYPETAPKKIKIGFGPLGLPSINPADSSATRFRLTRTCACTPLWVRGSCTSRLPVECLYPSQRIESLAVPYLALHLIGKRRGPHRDGKNRRNRCRIPAGMHFGGMHPAGSTNATTRKQTKRAAPHPNPLCSTKHFSLSGNRVSEWRV